MSDFAPLMKLHSPERRVATIPEEDDVDVAATSPPRGMSKMLLCTSYALLFDWGLLEKIAADFFGLASQPLRLREATAATPVTSVGEIFMVMVSLVKKIEYIRWCQIDKPENRKMKNVSTSDLSGDTSPLSSYFE